MEEVRKSRLDRPTFAELVSDALGIDSEGVARLKSEVAELSAALHRLPAPTAAAAAAAAVAGAAAAAAADASTPAPVPAPAPALAPPSGTGAPTEPRDAESALPLSGAGLKGRRALRGRARGALRGPAPRMSREQLRLCCRTACASR